jgi:hypothetical protein
MGFCMEHDGPGHMHHRCGMHRGRGFRGRHGHPGRGFRRRGHPGADRFEPGDELEMLKDDLEYLRAQLSATEERIREMESIAPDEETEDTLL